MSLLFVWGLGFLLVIMFCCTCPLRHLGTNWSELRQDTGVLHKSLLPWHQGSWYQGVLKWSWRTFRTSSPHHSFDVIYCAGRYHYILSLIGITNAICITSLVWSRGCRSQRGSKPEQMGKTAVFMRSFWFPCLITTLYCSDPKCPSTFHHSSAEFFLTSLFPPRHIWVLPELRLQFFLSWDTGDMTSGNIMSCRSKSLALPLASRWAWPN